MELFLQQILNGLVIGSTYAVVALGFSLIFSVLHVVNMAHPDIFMISMFVALFTGVATGNVFLSLGAVVVAAALMGALLERLVLRPLLGADILIPFLGTLGVGLVLENGLAGMIGSDPKPFPELVPHMTLNLGPLTLTTGQLGNMLVAVLVLVIVSTFIRRTKWGRAARAVAEGPEVAAAFGVNVNVVMRLTVVLASVLAGLAGMSIANMYGSAFVFVGGLYALKSVVCMLVSGNRNIEGIMVVGLSLGVLEALVAGYISTDLKDAVAFVALIAILYFRPDGIFGSYAVTAG